MWINFSNHGLYLIEILHQTTTHHPWLFKLSSCILSKFYIKPQLFRCFHDRSKRCILSKFYIKPQHFSRWFFQQLVVSYRNSTSNHNCRALYYFCFAVVSYRNSTSNHNQGWAYYIRVKVVSYRNSTSNHNQLYTLMAQTRVVSYRNSTSNHNSRWYVRFLTQLYLIEILHQTTTSANITTKI